MRTMLGRSSRFSAAELNGATTNVTASHIRARKQEGEGRVMGRRRHERRVPADAGAWRHAGACAGGNQVRWSICECNGRVSLLQSILRWAGRSAGGGLKMNSRAKPPRAERAAHQVMRLKNRRRIFELASPPSCGPCWFTLSPDPDEDLP